MKEEMKLMFWIVILPLIELWAGYTGWVVLGYPDRWMSYGFTVGMTIALTLISGFMSLSMGGEKED